MPLFQYARNAIISAYDAIPDSRFVKRSQASKHRQAEKLIRKSPYSAQGYFDSAQLYMEDNNLRAALKVYYAGIEALTSTTMNNNNSNTTSSSSKEKNTLKKYNHKNPRQQERKVKNNDSESGHSAQQEEEDVVALLKKEKLAIEATLVQLKRIFESLPYEILATIFGHLTNFQDLWECVFVCKVWRYFLITWPMFWNRLPLRDDGLYNPNPEDSTIVTSDPYHFTHAIYLHGPVNAGDMKVNDILNMFNSISNDHSFKKLSFKDFAFSSSQSVLLETVIRNMKAPPLEQIEFSNCAIPVDNMVRLIFLISSKLTHLTFTPPASRDFDSRFSAPYFPHPSIVESAIAIKSFSITYLKLHINSSANARIVNEKQLVSNMWVDYMLRRCSNLVHLFVDSNGDSIRLSKWASTAIHHCPRLETLVLGNCAEMPEPYLDDITKDGEFDQPPDSTQDVVNNIMNNGDKAAVDETSSSNYNIFTSTNPSKFFWNPAAKKGTPKGITLKTSKTSSTEYKTPSRTPTTITPATNIKGLRRLVYTKTQMPRGTKGKGPYQDYRLHNERDWKDFFLRFGKYHYHPIEFMYLDYDFISASFLHEWADFGVIAPCLRELHIRDALRPFEYDYTPSFKNGLIGKLFSCLPALEALVVIQQYTNYDANDSDDIQNIYRQGMLRFDDHALKQLAIHCPCIQHMKIVGQPAFTAKGLESFADILVDGHHHCQQQQHPSETTHRGTSSPVLSYMMMDIPHHIIPVLVEKIQSLRVLNVRSYRNIANAQHPTMPIDEREMVETILYERGGSLTLSAGDNYFADVTHYIKDF
ncbi:hypothetical protein BDA99DRAFT_557665 [Phascolomyces articulosus]|uniref:F-box domain-containing protein n=1 Tax=Phascolomyces articulosus TaxID=60185 RepID=A0AAD5PFQ6_9FUNG|nr:hypothetical protein BDA99DRAFT_557665 [Phascolomyces articulosus]